MNIIKKVSLIIFFSLIILCLPTQKMFAAVSLSSKILGLSHSSAIQHIGTPLKEETLQGYSVLWYDSSAPSQASFVYLKEDHVVFISQVIADNTVTLAQTIKGNGSPEFSKKLYLQGESLQQVIHGWPKKGIAIVSSGVEESSPVFRQMYFQPISKEQYLSTWGKDYPQNSDVLIPWKKEQTSPYYFSKNIIIFLVVISIVGILIGFFVLKTRKTRQIEES